MTLARRLRKNPGDPYWSSVTLLLPCKGADGSTSFPDKSQGTRTVTVGGATVVSTAQSKFAGASGLFGAAGADVLTVANADSAFSFGTGDFTLECWVRLNGTISGNRTILSRWRDETSEQYFIFWLNSTNLSFAYGNGTVQAIINRSTTFSAGQWYHVAVTRSGTTGRLFRNGVLVGSTFTSFTTNVGAVSTLYVGGRYSATDPLNGYLDDIRITKGVARYTADFTPPQRPHPEH